MSEKDVDNEVIAETETYVVFRSYEEPEGDYFHVALGGITLHLTAEEWNELVLLIKSADA